MKRCIVVNSVEELGRGHSCLCAKPTVFWRGFQFAEGRGLPVIAAIGAAGGRAGFVAKQIIPACQLRIPLLTFTVPSNWSS